jgi:AraC-like DNA-binding protein/ligand-binding sensor protein
MQSQFSLIQNLAHSELFQQYERAFTAATGLPVALRPVESWQLPYHGKPGEAPFSALLAKSSRACAALLKTQRKISTDQTPTRPCTVIDETGMCETVVPLRVGNELVGFLQTGQVFCKTPTRAQFHRVAKLAADWGVGADLATLESAYFHTKVLSRKKHDSAVRLLGIFAQHLAMASNQLVTEQHQPEPPFMVCAKAFIKKNLRDEISLARVAKVVNMSPFYFCKQFKKITGLNFTEYVSRTRIEGAKNLLLNPNLRISEIAYEVGFRSLTHFNRVFRHIVGESPTTYRQQLAHF